MNESEKDAEIAMRQWLQIERKLAKQKDCKMQSLVVKQG